jgi:hypothetical protein
MARAGRVSDLMLPTTLWPSGTKPIAGSTCSRTAKMKMSRRAST